MSIGSSSSTDTAPAPPLLPVGMAKHRVWLQHVAAPNHAHCLERETPSRLLPRAVLLLARAGQTSSPRRQNTRCHCCISMREHESHRCMREHERHRECDKIFDTVKRLTWETMKLITCLSLGARSVDRRRRTRRRRHSTSRVAIQTSSTTSESLRRFET
jgi:hypothetical protein